MPLLFRLVSRYSPEVPPTKMTAYVRFGAWIAGLDMFDASAFRLPRAEAATLDPQHRLLLECTATALRNCSVVGSAQTTGMPTFVGRIL